MDEMADMDGRPTHIRDQDISREDARMIVLTRLVSGAAIPVMGSAFGTSRSKCIEQLSFKLVHSQVG